MISRAEKIQCPWCMKISTLGEWNDATYAKCTSREMRRAFTNLSNEKAFTRKADTFYLCTKCNNWSRGCQLRIVGTENKALKKLGGEALFKTHSKSEDTE